MVSFPRVLKTARCPVPGCPEVVHSAGWMIEHFMYRHFLARIKVVQEGREPLPRCDLCGMHIPAGRLLKHQREKRCNRNTQMRWRWKDVAIVSQCEGMTFILTGEDDTEFIEGVETFKYLGRILDR